MKHDRVRRSGDSRSFSAIRVSADLRFSEYFVMSVSSGKGMYFGTTNLEVLSCLKALMFQTFLDLFEHWTERWHPFRWSWAQELAEAEPKSCFVFGVGSWNVSVHDFVTSEHQICTFSNHRSENFHWNPAPVMKHTFSFCLVPLRNNTLLKKHCGTFMSRNKQRFNSLCDWTIFLSLLWKTSHYITAFNCFCGNAIKRQLVTSWSCNSSFTHLISLSDIHVWSWHNPIELILQERKVRQS